MSATQQTSTQVHVRWMIRRDMVEVLAMDAGDHGHWGEDDFLKAIRGQNCIGMVAEGGGGEEVLGFVVYTLHKHKLHLHRLAVKPGARRQGIARTILARLIAKLSAHRRRGITIDVSEDNLAACLMLKANGFRCERIDRGAGDCGCDSLRFVYRVADEG